MTLGDKRSEKRVASGTDLSYIARRAVFSAEATAGKRGKVGYLLSALANPSESIDVRLITNKMKGQHFPDTCIIETTA